MQNILLIGINAKYIHSNLAIRSIRDYAADHYGITPSVIEFTINQRIEQILPEIYKLSPQAIGFSCYIWNYEMIKRLTDELKKLLPNIFIFLGGPEVTYHPEEVLNTSKADCVVLGEGEKICSELFLALMEQKELSSVPGIAFRVGDEIVLTPSPAPLEMKELPFVYREEDTEKLQNKIIYYESSRGCPFQCQYCLSGHGSKVRFLPLEQVYTHLDFFLAQRVKQVKFVDRTFNCNKQYALQIWKYLKEHDNGVTNFHFEIAAELLDEETLSFLQTVRKGFFQFEIGVQSTNPLTLQHIKRITKIDELRHIIARLQEGKNIHLHLDLIIGLPYEGYDRFGQSFDDVYALSPDQLQVGFLKLLRGSGLYANRQRYGIVASEYAPYEVLYTDHLSYGEILKLKMIEEMVETYYNSNRFRLLLRYLIPLFPSPFRFFEALAAFYEAKGYHLAAHSNLEYYTILHEFFQSRTKGEETLFQWYAKFDLYSHEKAKKLPDWLTVSLPEEKQWKEKSYQFYSDRKQIQTYLPQYAEMDTKQIYRQAHIEVFPFSPLTGEKEETPILFNYRNCDLLGNAEHTVISLP